LDNDAVENVKAIIAGMPKNINAGQQNKHIIGTYEYEQYIERLRRLGEYGPSRLNGGLEFAQQLVDEYAGTGEPEIRDDGSWRNVEKVVTDRIIGVAVNNLTGVEQPTTKMKIHYGQSGTHVVPDYMTLGRKKFEKAA
jgi:hypothetical protein